VTPGTPVSDTLTVVGSSANLTPSGSVNFFICGPIATGTCDGTTNVGTAAGTGTLSGSGGTATATSSPAVDTTGFAPGRYCFRAEWPGDSNYKPTPPATKFTESGTGDVECFFVSDTSSLTTAQNWLPNDSTSISTAGGTALNGSVVFTLYPGGTCTGTPLYTNPAIPISGSSPQTATTSNTTVKVLASTTVSWKAVYTSNDSTSGSSSSCETTALTIANN
jgi:hypothetical protein